MKYIAAGVMALGAVCMSAQDLESARRLAEDGMVEQALATLDSIGDDSEAMLFRGELLWSIGRDADAVAALRSAGTTEAKLRLADIAISRYNLDEAEAILESLKPKARRGRKPAAPPAGVAELEERAQRVADMLTRVEAVQIIDSVNVPADEFFRNYRLSSESGTIAGRDVLPRDVEADESTVVFIPQSGRQMIWSAPDTAGTNRLVWADALYGDEWDTPAPLGETLASDGADAAYPFMMPDGITLYYASDSDDSLGGYDIYMARRTDDGFLEPVNLGMPYNSPYNDYMMAVDEFTGIGWFASDRNRVPGMVTIYTYIPAEMRVNVDPEDPDLAAKALLSPLSAARGKADDVTAARRRMAALAAQGTALSAPDFTVYVPGRGVLTSYSQLPGGMAKQAARNYVEALQGRDDIARRLSVARNRYAGGDSSLAGEIQALERNLEETDTELRRLRNQLVEAAD